MHLMQHISLLGSVSNNCRHALSWSSYEDKCAILLRNGIYVLTLHPVPSNLSPSLNTAPKFLPHQTDEDPIFDLHWLPKGRLLTRTLSGITSVTEISTGHKQTIQCQSSVSCSYQDWLFLGDHQKTIHAFQDKGGSKNNLGFIEGVHELKLSANASEIIPLAIGASEILLFISLANGLLTVVRMKENEGKLEEITDPTSLWNDVDFQPASHLTIINQDFLESRHCFLAFSKGLYVVLTQVDLSSQTGLTVLKQQCIQVTTNRIIKLLPFKEKTCILATESGPLIEIVIDDTLESPCVYTPISVDLDHAQYHLNGFQSSTNKYLWIILQQGPYRHGENAKARLVILRNSNLSTLLTIPTHTLLREKVDFLELLRVLLLRSNCLPSLKEDLLTLGSNSSKSFLYWLSILLSMAGEDGWPQLAYNATKDLLVNEALKKLSNPHFKPSCAQFLQSFHQVQPTENVDRKWQCPTCLSTEDADKSEFLDLVMCKKGCQWPRCCLSFQACDQKRVAQCRWCGAVALSQFAGDQCPLCSGTIIDS